MAPPKGNKYYLLRSKDGREKKYETPDDLWKACCRYFLYVEKNPIREQKVFCSNGVVKKTTVTKMRAMTLAGLRLRLGLSESGYKEYRKRDDFLWVTGAVDDILYSQKFEGAAAGILNANIIARDLGLTDKSELTGKDGKNLIPVLNVTASRDKS